MKNMIPNHYANSLKGSKLTMKKTCSCPQKSECPINNIYLSKSLLTVAGEATANKAKNYFETRTKDFQECYSSYTLPLRNKNKEKSTTRLKNKVKNMFIINSNAVSQVWIYFCVRKM